MKTHLPVLLRRALLLAMAAVCTSTLSYAEESTPEPSKTPATLPEDGIWDGVDVNYSWNTASPKGYAKGLVLNVGSALTIQNGSAYFDNNAATAGGNSTKAEGAAVYVSTNFKLDNNSVVSFSGNSMSGGKKTDYGAAMYMWGGPSVEITNNESVLFNDNFTNTANVYDVKAYGGAISVGGSYSSLKITDNISVTAEGNNLSCDFKGSYAPQAYHRGAFIFSSGNHIIEISRNNTLTITGNYIEGEVPQDGAAIYVSIDDSTKEGFIPRFDIVGNGKVDISDNYVDSYGKQTVNGGAVYVSGKDADPHTPVFQISGNTEVSITNNAAKGSTARGGAIYANELEVRIQGNDKVLIAGNYEKNGANYCMRSIYMVSHVGYGTNAALYSSDTAFVLSANEGGSIEMQDGVHLEVEAAIKFNADYGDKVQTGDIILTGAYAEANLNKAIAANTAEGETPRTATEAEITKSQEFSFMHYYLGPSAKPEYISELKEGVLATLEGGRLRVEDGARYIGMGFEAVADSDSTLRLKDAAFEHCYTSSSYGCELYYDVTFGATTTLEAEGVNTMTAGNLTMKDGSAMSYVVGSENTTSAVLSFVGGDKTTAVTGQNSSGKDVWEVIDATSSLTQEGNMTIWIKDSEALVRGQRYALLTISDNVTLNWDADKLTVKGAAKASDLAWDGKTLYLTYNRGALEVATWANEEGNNKWDSASQNWVENGYLYSDAEVARKVLFDDTAEGGEVELVGTHTPNQVEVNNSEGNDYTFTGEGSLDGEMKLVKNGEGSLLIDTENSYSGGTEVNGGELAVGSETALGTGKVSLKDDGTLNLGSQAVANDIEAAGGVLRGADQYLGNLVVSEDLTIEGSATAKSITMLNKAVIEVQSAALYSRRATPAAAEVSTNAMYVRTEGDGNFSGSLTLNEGGLIELNNGNSLVVTGTLTLGNGTKLVLNGDYAAGDTLVSATESLTLGDVTLVYDNNAVVMEQQGNSLVLVGNFKQEEATASTLSNWGIATASRAVVNAVRGQRNNTGCIANGKGTAWVASLGSKHDINGSDIDISGAAVGADMQVGRDSRIGIALGYAEGEVQPSGLRQVDQEGSYVAAYGEHGLKKLSATSCLSMDWVAAYGTTDSEVGGLKWEQDSLQLNSRVNWNKKVNNRLCMSVFGGLEYFANNSDTVDGVKTGSIQNLRGEIGVGARYVAWGTPAVTDGKSGLVLAQGCEKLVLNGEIRYMNDMVRSNPVIRMNGLSGMGDNPGRQGIGIEAGATYRIGERWSASANYGFNTMEDSKEHRLNIGAAYTF